MKKAGFALVIVGMLVASLLLLNVTLTPQVAASSEKITTKQAPPLREDGVDRGLPQYGQCPPGYFYSNGNCLPYGE